MVAIGDLGYRIAFILIVVLIGPFLLHFLSVKFKLRNTSYKNAFLIASITAAIQLIFLLGLQGIWASLFVVLIFVLVGYALIFLKYNIPWHRSLLMWLSWFVMLFIVSLLVSLIIALVIVL